MSEPSEKREARPYANTVPSVFFAEGLHHDLDADALKAIPRRFDPEASQSCMAWFGTLCLSGIGMFIVAYIIITTGQIKLIWQDQYPECWTANTDALCTNGLRCCGTFSNNPNSVDGVCNLDAIDGSYCAANGNYPDSDMCRTSILNSISYAEFAGIMAGMLTFGFVADVIGRTRAGILTSLMMVAGIGVMSFYDNYNKNGLFLGFSIAYALFGCGVGGEYPLAAQNAAAHQADSIEESTMDEEERQKCRILREHERTARRGENFAMVFAMQGLGAVFGSLVLVILIYFSGQSRPTCSTSFATTNARGANSDALNLVWRTFYMIGGMFIILMLAYRSFMVGEDTGHTEITERQKAREEKFGPGVSNKLKVIWFYLPRLIGTGGSWFSWDVTFYGLRLFSGPIFSAINPGGALIVQNGYLLLNNLIALMGYYCAALVIDKPIVGRVRLQMFSFGISALIFLVTAGIFDRARPGTLIALFFMSSFFGQFGSNVTTYVIAAETYPTELRGTCHGLSAFLGKTGALLATTFFSHFSIATIFLTCGVVSILGFFFTLIFSVDLTHVSLAEHDAQLELLLEGRPEAYKGKLNDSKHLSYWEIITGRHGEYKPGWAGDFIKNEIDQGFRLSALHEDAQHTVLKEDA